MPLDKSCSVDAMSSNISQSVKDGKEQKQAVAIAFSVLKTACGVEGEKKMTPKEIVAAGKEEVAVSFGSVQEERSYWKVVKTKYTLADIDGVEGTIDKPGKAVEGTMVALAKALEGFEEFSMLPEVDVEIVARNKDDVELHMSFRGAEMLGAYVDHPDVQDMLKDWWGERRWSDSEDEKMGREAAEKVLSPSFHGDLVNQLKGSKFFLKGKTDTKDATEGSILLHVKPSDFGLTVESVSTKVRVTFGAEPMDEKAKGESTPMVCQECGAKFKKKLTAKTFEVKCPKCGSFDTEPE